MLRFLIWFLVAYMFVKVVRIFLNWKQYRDPDHERIDHSRDTIPPFNNVQDADFEDITPKPPPPESDQPPP